MRVGAMFIIKIVGDKSLDRNGSGLKKKKP